MTHTPGPWEAHKATEITSYVDAPTGRVANAFSLPDARLIAAAPDMLAALQLAVRSRWLSIDFDCNRTKEACDIRHAMCTAIRKAEEPQS